MRHVKFIIYLMFMVSIFNFFISCRSAEEKKRYEELVNKHLSLPSNNDSILFDLVINEPKVISMGKLYEKGLYSERGRSIYTINSSNEYIRKLIWDFNVSFYNDSLKGVDLYSSVSEFDFEKTKKSLIDLFSQKYNEHCVYEGSDYFFYGNVMIELEGEKGLSSIGGYKFRLKYEQIYWFPRMDFPAYGEKDEYGNNELHNYYSEKYKKPKEKKDPALNDI